MVVDQAWRRRLVRQHVEQTISLVLKAPADVVIDYKFKHWLSAVCSQLHKVQLATCPELGEYRVTGLKPQIISLLKYAGTLPCKIRVRAPTKLDQWIALHTAIQCVSAELEIGFKAIVAQLLTGVRGDGARTIGGTALAG